MTGTCDPFKMFSFSVIQCTFCFPNVEILAIPTTSSIHNFRHLGTVDFIFVGKKGLDGMDALKNHPKINAAIRFINAGLKLFCNSFTLCP